jgi:ferrous iron transport protein B
LIRFIAIPQIAARQCSRLSRCSGRSHRQYRRRVNGTGGALTDPIGISIGDVTDLDAVTEAQGVKDTTLTNVTTLFNSPFSAVCYLVFVLLYAPCVAVLGAVNKELGWQWTLLVFSWCTGLAYITATVTYQIGVFRVDPLLFTLWITSMYTILILFVTNLKRLSRKMVLKNMIPAVQL